MDTTSFSQYHLFLYIIFSDDLLPTSSIAIEMKDKFASVGLVHVTNTSLSDAREMRTLVRIVMGEETEYEGGNQPRRRVSYDT